MFVQVLLYFITSSSEGDFFFLTVVVSYANSFTGEILAMVSMPNYDPNDLAVRTDAQVEDTAYLNRCLQGLYTPGSVFKIVTLASALGNDTGVTGQAFSCAGEWAYEGGHIVCAGNTAHGILNLKDAFKRSCNVTFGKLAYQLGLERLRATAERFGFNENFKFGDFVIYNSAFPEAVNSMNGLVWAGIGQGEVLVTPLHMAMIAGTVANGGAMMKPLLIQRVTNTQGATTAVARSEVYRQVLDGQTAGIIADFMAHKRADPGYVSTDRTEFVHTDEILKLMSLLTDDDRYELTINEEGGKPKNMCEMLDRVEARGIEKGMARGRAEGEDMVIALLRKLAPGSEEYYKALNASPEERKELYKKYEIA